jgi:hypothetical protein
MKTPSRGSAPKRPERRRGNRPKTGDVRACPRCRLGEIEFNERYRVDGQTIPAWLCDNAQCGYRELVRVPMTPAGESRRRARAIRADAQRLAMRVRATADRSKKLLESARPRAKNKTR